GQLRLVGLRPGPGDVLRECHPTAVERGKRPELRSPAEIGGEVLGVAFAVERPGPVTPALAPSHAPPYGVIAEDSLLDLHLARLPQVVALNAAVNEYCWGGGEGRVRRDRSARAGWPPAAVLPNHLSTAMVVSRGERPIRAATTSSPARIARRTVSTCT